MYSVPVAWRASTRAATSREPDARVSRANTTLDFASISTLSSLINALYVVKRASSEEALASFVAYSSQDA